MYLLWDDTYTVSIGKHRFGFNQHSAPDQVTGGRVYHTSVALGPAGQFSIPIRAKYAAWLTFTLLIAVVILAAFKWQHRKNRSPA
jgi:hypothetical protein